MNAPSPIAGPKPPRKFPKVGAETILLHADRFNRSAQAQDEWARTAKRCVDYYEGRQWSAQDLKILAEQGRPALTINKIKQLVNLVWGYHLTNATDIRYLPGHDQLSSAEVGKTLTALAKNVVEQNGLFWLDMESFFDGIVAGRGFTDWRMDFSENILGEVKITAADPFAKYLDPDAVEYDVNDHNFIFDSRWVSPEEIEFIYGHKAYEAAAPLVQHGGFTGLPSLVYDGTEEITPVRRFGHETEDSNRWWDAWGWTYHNMVDRARKQIRLLAAQHWVPVERWFFIDLETGDKKPVPDHWKADKVQRAMAWAEANGDPLVVKKMKTRRLRETHLIGDICVYDDWSPYESMTTVGFFPYFRRGQTRGMVHDLLDPQDEVNKRRASRLNMVNRSAAGGWMIEKQTLDAQQRSNLRLHGSAPGLQLFYDSKGGTLPAPQQIMPGVAPVAMSQLEDEAENDLLQISGINESALGQIEAANASGRAVEARQRQTVVGLENFMANHKRTKQFQGRKLLQLIQNFYTQARIIRTTGADRARSPETIIINQRTGQQILNDVTLGKYQVAIDESPVSANFLEAQFNELLKLKELGMPIPDDALIEASSIGRKDEILQALAAARQAEAMGVVPPEAGGGGGPAVGSQGDAVAASEPGVPIPAE